MSEVCNWWKVRNYYITDCGKRIVTIPEKEICCCGKPINRSILYLANSIYKKPKAKIEFLSKPIKVVKDDGNVKL